MPELAEREPDLVTARATEVLALAPDLVPLVPDAPQTLTNIAKGVERTRFYPAERTRRLAHGIAELLTDWARLLHPEGVVVAFRDLAQADPTDRELVAVLLRRCDPKLLTLIVETGTTETGTVQTDAVQTGALSATPWKPPWPAVPIVSPDRSASGRAAVRRRPRPAVRRLRRHRRRPRTAPRLRRPVGGRAGPAAQRPRRRTGRPQRTGRAPRGPALPSRTRHGPGRHRCRRLRQGRRRLLRPGLLRGRHGARACAHGGSSATPDPGATGP
ncbi:hypothetical protein GXW82_00385 [Streptacidiphilus sp. 4-A2]|nr:hypothetical protein [Streptacidiphilus sp. 4-A2]